ncbi:MAG: S8 family serine peptidase, partial [Bdellovibrionota bacterium]
DVSDQYGHGTHVAGIVAANGSQSQGAYKGVAPNANIINLRVLDANGSGNDSSVIAAIQRAIELKGQYNIRVINLSLGRGIYESFVDDPLNQAVEKAWQSGIVVVVAAGNKGRDNTLGTNGYGTIGVPGNDPFIITVGAMDTNGTLTAADDNIQEWLSFYLKSPITKAGLKPEHDLHVQKMKLENTLRYLGKEELINHLGLTYYGYDEGDASKIGN